MTISLSLPLSRSILAHNSVDFWVRSKKTKNRIIPQHSKKEQQMYVNITFMDPVSRLETKQNV